jgi:hypothetical protein
MKPLSEILGIERQNEILSETEHPDALLYIQGFNKSLDQIDQFVMDEEKLRDYILLGCKDDYSFRIATNMAKGIIENVDKWIVRKDWK